MTITSTDRYTRITDEYRDMRERLEGAASKLERLKERRAATLQGSRDAGQHWRKIFKEAGGVAGKDVRDLQAEEHALAAEVEQLDDLIRELTQHVDELKHWTGELRKRHVTSLYLTRRELAATRLTTALDTVFEKPEGQDLLEALSQRADSLSQEVIEDHVFMAGIGFDGHEGARAGFIAMVSRDDRRKITDEAERRKRALIADVVMKRIDALGEGHPRFDDALAAPLSPLACEQ